MATPRAGAVRITGGKELRDELAKLVNEVTGKEMKEVYYQAATILRDEAKRRVPVKTGLLKRAIFASKGEERRPNALVGVDYRQAPHAHLVEFGHGGRSPAGPKPYMRPALEAKRKEIRQAMVDGLSAIVEKYTE